MKRLIPIFCVVWVCACTFNPGPNPGTGTDRSDVSDVENVSDAKTDGTQNLDSGQEDILSDTRSPEDVNRADVTDVSADVTHDVQPDAPIQNICDGVQRDLQNDPDHCGRCNNACDDNFGGCVDGDCLCPFSTETCGGLNTCTDTEFDPNNCGGCGVQCSPGEYCINDVCSCRPGFTLCNGECVDTDNDPSYCGSCTNSCNGDGCKDGSCENNTVCSFRWRCEVPNEGFACIRGRTNDLHCGPTVGNPCGTVCGSDEVCYDPGIGRPPGCYTYRPAIRCQSCPCNECEDNEICNVSEDIPGEIYCVAN